MIIKQIMLIVKHEDALTINLACPIEFVQNML
jgi:hypothetical protein